MEYVDYLSAKSMDQKDLKPERSEMEIRIKTENKNISDYHRNTVLAGKCSGILPMRCINYGDETEMIYDLEGFTTVREFTEHNTGTAEEILMVIKKIIYAAAECERWLISEEEYIISPDSIFISENGKPYFIFDPKHDRDGTGNLRERFAEMIFELCKSLNHSAEIKAEINDFIFVLQSGGKRISDLMSAAERYISGRTALRKKEETVPENIKRGDGKKKDAKQVIKEAFIKLIT